VSVDKKNTDISGTICPHHSPDDGDRDGIWNVSNF